MRFASREALMAFRRKRYERAQRRARRAGPGEGGAPVVLTPDEQQQADKLFAKETFNVVASDKVALDRSIRDTRHPEYVNDVYVSYRYTDHTHTAHTSTDHTHDTIIIIIICNY